MPYLVSETVDENCIAFVERVGEMSIVDGSKVHGFGDVSANLIWVPKHRIAALLACASFRSS